MRYTNRRILYFTLRLEVICAAVCVISTANTSTGDQYSYS